MPRFELQFKWPGTIYIEAKDEDEAHEKLMETASNTNLYNIDNDDLQMEDPIVSGCWEVL